MSSFIADTVSSHTPSHVVIVGGGFGGLTAAKALRRHRHVRVTRVDRRNQHLVQPPL